VPFSRNPNIHAAREEPCRCLQCSFSLPKVKANRPNFDNFLGFSLAFMPFLPIFLEIVLQMRKIRNKLQALATAAPQ